MVLQVPGKEEDNIIKLLLTISRIHPQEHRHTTDSSTLRTVHLAIVSRGEWLWSPANIKRANKDVKLYVGRSTTMHNILFCVHALCMIYVINTFLLVSSSVSSKQLLCFVHGQGQKREQKHTLTTKNFFEFHNHSPQLTMTQRERPEFILILSKTKFTLAT